MIIETREEGKGAPIFFPVCFHLFASIYFTSFSWYTSCSCSWKKMTWLTSGLITVMHYTLVTLKNAPLFPLTITTINNSKALFFLYIQTCSDPSGHTKPLKFLALYTQNMKCMGSPTVHAFIWPYERVHSHPAVWHRCGH